MHEDIFALVYYGNGFSHSDVYNMPVYLRKFYHKKLIDLKKEEKKEIDKINNTVVSFKLDVYKNIKEKVKKILN